MVNRRFDGQCQPYQGWVEICMLVSFIEWSFPVTKSLGIIYDKKQITFLNTLAGPVKNHDKYANGIDGRWDLETTNANFSTNE